MGRALRPDSTGGWFHVVNRGVARQTIFFDDRDRLEFERVLGLACERFGVRVHAYCWMTNHYHLLVECPTGKLTDTMHLAASLFVRHVNDRHGRDGPLFKDRFFARPVDSDAYLLHVVRYIHRNPLAMMPPDRLAEYRWSSLRVYLGARRSPAWLTTETLIETAGGRERLVDFILEPCGESNARRLGAESWLGLVDLVADWYSDEVGPRQSRLVAVMLLDRLAEPDRSELAEALGFPTKRAEQMARLRARRQLDSHPRWNDILDHVLDAAA